MAKVRLIYGVTFYEQLLAEISHTLNFSSRISLAEHYIYGSNRLGARMVDQELYRNQLQHEGLEPPMDKVCLFNFNAACLGLGILGEDILVVLE